MHWTVGIWTIGYWTTCPLLLKVLLDSTVPLGWQPYAGAGECLLWVGINPFIYFTVTGAVTWLELALNCSPVLSFSSKLIIFSCVFLIVSFYWVISWHLLSCVGLINKNWEWKQVLPDRSWQLPRPSPVAVFSGVSMSICLQLASLAHSEHTLVLGLVSRTILVKTQLQNKGGKLKYF